MKPNTIIEILNPFKSVDAIAKNKDMIKGEILALYRKRPEGHRQSEFSSTK